MKKSTGVRIWNAVIGSTSGTIRHSLHGRGFSQKKDAPRALALTLTASAATKKSITIPPTQMNDETKSHNIIFRAAADLFPGYFALVMATGIISIASFLLEMKTLAWTLFFLNIVAYVILWLLLLLRLTLFFPRVKMDITDHVRGPGFFTVVAGTCILGSQLVIVAERDKLAGGFWFAGLLLWAIIMYAFFTFV